MLETAFLSFLDSSEFTCMSFLNSFKKIARVNAFVAFSCLTFSTCNLVFGLTIEVLGLEVNKRVQAYTHSLAPNSCLAIALAIPWVLTANRLKKASEAQAETSEQPISLQVLPTGSIQTSMILVSSQALSDAPTSLNAKYHPHDLN